MPAGRSITLAGGRQVRVHDTGADDRAQLTVLWHHGTPGTGDPPAPLLGLAADLGIRWVGYDRPGYGGSGADVARRVTSAAQDAEAVADALGVERFFVLGYSGGSAAALACAALLPDRVPAAATLAAIAPPDAGGLDWFEGMASAGIAELRAAMAGREALEELLTSTEFDPEQFTAADHAALSGEWSWVGTVAQGGTAGGLGGMVDDDLAYVAPWGFDPAAIRRPVLLVHGADDRVVPLSHSQWLRNRIGTAELRIRPASGHVAVLTAGAEVLHWLREQADG